MAGAPERGNNHTSIRREASCMRIALVHNPEAGDGSFDRGQIVRHFRDRGCQVEEFGKKPGQVRRAVRTAPDLLVVAGGDGTVAKSVKALDGSRIPLLILPVGTANNIARSLGIEATLPESIDAAMAAPRVRFDVGCADAPWGAERFVEAAGIGFLGTLLRRELRGLPGVLPVEETRGRSREVNSAAGVAELIRCQTVRTMAIVADGVDLGGEYLTVEAMNIRALGPRIVLAPEAHSGDGQLDLVLIRPEERDALVAYVAERKTPGELPPFARHRVSRATLSWSRSDGHLDDEAWPRKERKVGARDTVTISLAGAVDVVVP